MMMNKGPGREQTPIVVFSDIDGTLIDFATYSWAESATAVAQLLLQRIPIVLCSSKTRAEQEWLRQALAIPDPFIVENGSAIFLPADYFPALALPVKDGWQIIELGIKTAAIRRALAEIHAQMGVSLSGYADLSVAELAQVTGLELPAAARAQQREYSETLVSPLDADSLTLLQAELAARGLAIASGGKFYTVTGAGSNKGTAVAHLITLFRQKLGAVTTIGLGDSANDLPMLAAVDRPYLLQKPGGVWQEAPGVAVNHVAAVGPTGWHQAIFAALAA